MPFDFRLKTLLRIRKRMEEAAEMEFATLLHRRDRARNALEAERSRLQDARDDMDQGMEKGIMSDEFEFKWLQISHLEERCRKFAAELEEAETEVLRGRAELERRHVEKELVARLEQRDQRKYIQEVDRQRQKEMDDMASVRHGRLKGGQ